MQILPTQSLSAGLTPGSVAEGGDSVTGAFSGLLGELLSLLAATPSETPVAGDVPDVALPVDVESADSDADEADVIASEESVSDVALDVSGAIGFAVAADAKGAVAGDDDVAVPTVRIADAVARAGVRPGDAEASRARNGGTPLPSVVAPRAETPVELEGVVPAPPPGEGDGADPVEALLRTARFSRAVATESTSGESAARAAPSLSQLIESHARADARTVANAPRVEPAGLAPDAGSQQGAAQQEGDSLPAERPALRISTEPNAAGLQAARASFEVVQASVQRAGPESGGTPTVEISPVGATVASEAAPDARVRSLDVVSGSRSVPEPQAVAETAVRSVRHVITRGAGGGEETITVRLVPESLGEMHVTVRRGANQLEVQLASAHHGVRDVLESQLPAMREALAREGIDLTRASVSHSPLGDSGSGGTAQSHAQGQSGSTHRGNAPGQAQGQDGSPSGFGAKQEGASAHTTRQQEGSLNVLV